MNEDCYPITHHRKWWQFWKPKCWIEWVNIEDSKIKVITKGKD